MLFHAIELGLFLDIAYRVSTQIYKKNGNQKKNENIPTNSERFRDNGYRFTFIGKADSIECKKCLCSLFFGSADSFTVCLSEKRGELFSGVH